MLEKEGSGNENCNRRRKSTTRLQKHCHKWMCQSFQGNLEDKHIVEWIQQQGRCRSLWKAIVSLCQCICEFAANRPVVSLRLLLVIPHLCICLLLHLTTMTFRVYQSWLWFISLHLLQSSLWNNSKLESQRRRFWETANLFSQVILEQETHRTILHIMQVELCEVCLIQSLTHSRSFKIVVSFNT